MTLLVAIVLLHLPFSYGAFRNHLSDTLKLKCDALHYRSNYVKGQCYFAVLREINNSRASAECSSILFGAKAAYKVPAEIFSVIMVDKTKFHLDSHSYGAKHVLCISESEYKCDGESSLLGGKCIVRAAKKMNFVDADNYCKSLGMHLPAPDNDIDNKIARDALMNELAWIQKSNQQENGFKWKQTKTYQRWSTCDKPNAVSQSCSKNMAAPIDTAGYWSIGEFTSTMEVICMKDAKNDFVQEAPACIYHDPIDLSRPRLLPALDMLNQSRTLYGKTWTTARDLPKTCPPPICYTLTQTTTRYEILDRATVETRRGCEWICSGKTECVGFSFHEAGFSSSCVLLSIANPNICPSPTTIFLKKTSGCTPRTNYTEEFGEDPCVDEIVPSAMTKTFGSHRICPQNKSKLFVIRAITMDGRRITLDNDIYNWLEKWCDMWIYRFNWIDQTFLPIVAATCAYAGDEKCPCAPYELLENIGYKGYYPAVSNIGNPCKQRAFLHLKPVKVQWPQPSYIPYEHIENTTLTCHAGQWILWQDKFPTTQAVNKLSCLAV